MKSVLITILLFAAVMCAIRFHVFDVMSSTYAYYISGALLCIVLLIAVKTLGNPFKKRNDRHEKK